MLLFNSIQPNELVVKRLAMMGCTALVLAHRWVEAASTCPPSCKQGPCLRTTGSAASW